MGRISGEIKSVLVSTRVTPRIRDYALQLADREGLSVSEWIRKLIIVELKKSNSLPKLIREPK